MPYAKQFFCLSSGLPGFLWKAKLLGPLKGTATPATTTISSQGKLRSAFTDTFPRFIVIIVFDVFIAPDGNKQYKKSSRYRSSLVGLVISVYEETTSTLCHLFSDYESVSFYHTIIVLTVGARYEYVTWRVQTKHTRKQINSENHKPSG